MNTLTFIESFNEIFIEDITENPENFYEVSDIEALADDIERQGLQHNLVVAKNDEEVDNFFSFPNAELNKEEPTTYRIISGHRRFLAIKLLYESGRTTMKKVPCTVREYNSPEEEKLDLIMLNATSRKLSDSECIKQYETALKAIDTLKNQGKKVGKSREYLSKLLGISQSQISKLEKIEKKGSEELKEAIKDGDLSVANAYEISGLNEDKQSESIKNLKGEKSKRKKPKKPPESEAIKDFKKFLKQWSQKLFSSDVFEENAEIIKTQLEEYIAL